MATVIFGGVFFGIVLASYGIRWHKKVYNLSVAQYGIRWHRMASMEYLRYEMDADEFAELLEADEARRELMEDSE